MRCDLMRLEPAAFHVNASGEFVKLLLGVGEQVTPEVPVLARRPVYGGVEP